MSRYLLVPWSLFLLGSASAGALDVSLELDRSACGSAPVTHEALNEVTWRRVSPSSVELRAWHLVTGGCTMQPATLSIAVAGRTIAIAQQSKCPEEGEPILMCADYVLGVYRIQGLDSSAYDLILPMEAIVGHVAIDG